VICPDAAVDHTAVLCAIWTRAYEPVPIVGSPAILPDAPGIDVERPIYTLAGSGVLPPVNRKFRILFDIVLGIAAVIIQYSFNV
jgi:hypothetical protein